MLAGGKCGRLNKSQIDDVGRFVFGNNGFGQFKKGFYRHRRKEV